VQFTNEPDAGVPRVGVVSVALVDNTTLPDPVEDVTPVPPFATANVPAITTGPVCGEAGVRPVVPPEIDVTPPPPPPPAAQDIVPSLVELNT
jgi:hypothetical protein